MQTSFLEREGTSSASANRDIHMVLTVTASIRMSSIHMVFTVTASVRMSRVDMVFGRPAGIRVSSVHVVFGSTTGFRIPKPIHQVFSLTVGIRISRLRVDLYIPLWQWRGLPRRDRSLCLGAASNDHRWCTRRRQCETGRRCRTPGRKSPLAGFHHRGCVSKEPVGSIVHSNAVEHGLRDIGLAEIPIGAGEITLRERPRLELAGPTSRESSTELVIGGKQEAMEGRGFGPMEHLTDPFGHGEGGDSLEEALDHGFRDTIGLGSPDLICPGLNRADALLRILMSPHRPLRSLPVFALNG